MGDARDPGFPPGRVWGLSYSYACRSSLWLPPDSQRLRQQVARGKGTALSRGVPLIPEGDPEMGRVQDVGASL